MTRFFFPLSPRTLEAWPLTWRYVNGKALCEVVELFAMAQAKLDAAPMIRAEPLTVRRHLMRRIPDAAAEACPDVRNSEQDLP